jgi:hypothetical protein
MRWHNGRIKYSYQPKKICYENTQTNNEYYDNYENICLPIPRTRSLVRKIPIQRFYKKYYRDVDNITDTYIKCFNRFLETHPAYQVYFDEEAFRYNMLNAIYKSSSNAYRNLSHISLY